MLRRIAFIICCFLCLNATAQTADDQRERIIDFHSDIDIDTTGMVKVSEHIRVHAEGSIIRHGIVRFIPLYRKDKFGTGKRIDFEIINVQKNGKIEPFHTEEDNGNRKIFVGNPDSTLSPGDYEYTVGYQSRGHVGFYKTYDELYWNVTGNQWDFDIDKVSATITFPKGAVPGNASCYTGVAGSTSTSCNSVINSDHSITFMSANTFSPGEGFTVAVAFTPNIVKRPSATELFYNDYLLPVVSVLMIVVGAIAYFLIWRIFGKDPEKPVVVPSFHVPNNWSPAMVRYFYNKGKDNKTTAVAFINMGVRGHIKISSVEGHKSQFQFDKINPDTAALSPEEVALSNRLFKDRDSITTATKNADIFVAARELFSNKLKANLKLSQYYTRNAGPSFVTGLLSVAAIVGFLLYFGYRDVLPILIVVPFLIVGIAVLVGSVKNFRKSIAAGIFTMLFGLGFTIIPLAVASRFVQLLPPVAIIAIVALLIMYVFMLFQMARYTSEGVAIQSQMEGFRMYLQTAEEHRLNLLNPPERTPQVFEKFLPYAIALGVENEWGAKFAEVLAAAQYQPDWYYSPYYTYYDFTTSTPSSFYSAVSVSPPSDGGSSGSSSWSSGSGGGGSSGGGGGGGGGGGW